jgi:FixJ family two-component response regulator
MKNQDNDSNMTEKDARVLVVDDDTAVCDVLEQIISRLGIKVQTTTKPLKVLDLVRDTFFNVILLDIRMPKKSGMELLPEITEVSPDTKVIVISGFGDKDSAISALRLGAFDFLEKPLDHELLTHSINRALETQKTELAYKYEKEKLYDANSRLAENNEALSTLAKNMDSSRNDYEANMEKKIKVAILPIIENLQQSKDLSQNHRRDIGLLMDLMADLTSTFDTKQDLFEVLTPTELHIALLIRNGLSTDEIAKHMHISPETVKSHRKNSRKKLGLDKTHHNLRAHLQDTLHQ